MYNIAPYEQVPGTFDLSDPVERDYRTCRHCVFALMDVSGDHIQHLYLAQSGTLVLDSVSFDTGEFVGSVKGAGSSRSKRQGITRGQVRSRARDAFGSPS